MEATIVSPVTKDKVLELLCTNATPEQLISWVVPEILKSTGLSFDELHAVLSYFNRIGFVSELNLRRNSAHFILLVEANDYYLRGGFAYQEDLLEKIAEILLLEIESLKKQLGPNYLETTNKLASIASTILTGIATFKK